MLGKKGLRKAKKAVALRENDIKKLSESDNPSISQNASQLLTLTRAWWEKHKDEVLKESR